MQYPILAFIGAGNMTKAIIGGLVKTGYPADKIIAANPGDEKLQQLSSEFGIRTTNNNSQAAISAEVVVLAVKPWVIPVVCKEIEDTVDQQLIISIAAGKTTTSIRKHLQNSHKIIRAMPNTPCLISKGMTGLFAQPEVVQQDKEFVSSLFQNVGDIIWIDNEQSMDIITALSGSGPAYYFYMTEALIKAGIKLGLDPDVSTKLVTQTAFGAVDMLTNQPLQSAEKLRNAVTSPNGTTEAAINVFDKNQLMDILADAVQAATNRGHEMSQEID